MIECLVPSLDEQRATVGHIDDGLQRLAALQSEAEYATGFLKERRSALISAAVTGKIDVRGYAETPADALP
jgi:type I restriction enzyme S subunit